MDAYWNKQVGRPSLTGEARRAIHTDLMIDGPDMLTRFNGEPDQILAYYRSILDVLESRGIAPVLVVPLRHAVEEMAELMPAPSEGA